MKKSAVFFAFFFFIILSGCSSKLEKDALKVITLNIRYDNPCDSVNSWVNRKAVLCKFILNEDPDIIGLQEVLWKQYEVLDSALSEYSSTGVGRDDGARRGEMNPLFFRKSRFDMVRTITFWLSDTPEVAGSLGWGASLPRIVTWAELVDKNSHQHIFCFNTHLAHDSDSARLMSSNILLKEVERITEGFPCIVTGDFNLLPSSSGYAMLTGPAESVPLLEDSYIISRHKPTGPLFTFNGFSDKTGDGRVDYIFVKNGMKVMHHKTSMLKENDVYVSDHWPVSAIISIK